MFCCILSDPCIEGGRWSSIKGVISLCLWGISAAQKIKKLSESPTTVPIVAKLCFINCKNKKMPENGQSDHFQACRQGSPRVAKGRQGFLRSKGDPRDG